MRVAIGFGLEPERLIVGQKAHVARAEREANARPGNPGFVVLMVEQGEFRGFERVGVYL